MTTREVANIDGIDVGAGVGGVRAIGKSRTGLAAGSKRSEWRHTVLALFGVGVGVGADANVDGVKC